MQNRTRNYHFVVEAGFLALDDNTPVYLISSDSGGPMIFENYEDSPPPESKFDIPETCKNALPPDSEHFMSSFIPANTFSRVFRKNH